ncbi:MAG TPA: HEAT repeat domain-containing protein, partial [Polyangiales bacterium]|nr:HEAT repeat domain-containing protein [Polyangiales bacterium]
MLRDNRLKLTTVPLAGSLRRLVDALRALPLPKPLQRLSERGLERLRARLPELAALLDGKPHATRSTVPPSSREPAELVAQLASSDYRQRVRAVQALVHQRAPAAVDALSAALRDRSVEVAVAAVGSLQIVAGRKAQRTLREVVDDEQRYYHPLVRASAV